MNSNLLFDFTVDKQANAVFINREFAADRSLVWDALPNRKSLTNGGRRNPGHHELNLWTLNQAAGDCMPW
jgi:hypothetical protein